MDLRNEAEILAVRPYIDQVILTETTDDQPIYIALSPELEGCIAQGETIETAISNLRDARIDFIQSLLEDGLPVPEPLSVPTITTSSLTANYANVASFDTPSHGIALVREQPGAYSLNRIVAASLTT
jgi:predicted RNase H-like HicB family nuclease